MVGLDPFREVVVEDCVVRWLLLPCVNPFCTRGRHRYGMVSVDGGLWVLGLYPSDHDDVEEHEEQVPDDRDAMMRQALVFGVEWDRVSAKVVHRQHAAIETLAYEGAVYLLGAPVDNLLRLRGICRGGAMVELLELCGRFGFNEGGRDGGDG